MQSEPVTRPHLLDRALAVGTGFRKEAQSAIRRSLHEFDVLEVTVDHYLHGTPRVRERILAIADELPVVVHGVGLSVGTAVLPDKAYLDAVADFVERVQAPWYSEHLAFTGVPGRDLAQLIPLPRTRESLDVLAENLAVVRAHVQVPIVLENITYYFTWPQDEYDEVTFLVRALQESGAFLLLDLENLRINASNHGFNPVAFINALPPGIVRAVHVAGGMREGLVHIDSHNRPVSSNVLQLLARTLLRQMPDTIIVERDDALDAFDEVVADCQHVRSVVAGFDISNSASGVKAD
ncbi:DUF692 domain-containing protein [Rhodococcus sp. 105337]|uniref:DUF692 domain-containing protein n=1 Tax=Rhodococcus sp. 105337 TaxID=2725310 RepID=UPI00146A2E9F|nr:DUF692 domain-containing protein [Rhodococcus sp. 105337]NME81487.1 DUF692 domain-containing protein [Rhodococcus sp. 105337]